MLQELVDANVHTQQNGSDEGIESTLHHGNSDAMRQRPQSTPQIVCPLTRLAQLPQFLRTNGLASKPAICLQIATEVGARAGFIQVDGVQVPWIQTMEVVGAIASTTGGPAAAGAQDA